jgi:hydrogenase maturation protease
LPAAVIASIVEELNTRTNEAQGLCPTQPRLLIAGIGNIFRGDDGFGVEVIKRLATAEFPSVVHVVDFGIRGFALADALQDGYETAILVDAYPHGQPPGTVALMEFDRSHLPDERHAAVDAHGMNPMNVLRLANAINSRLPRILLVGCEPDTFGGDEGRMGLSVPVEAAVNEAVSLITSVVNQILQEHKAEDQQQGGRPDS